MGFRQYSTRNFSSALLEWCSSVAHSGGKVGFSAALTGASGLASRWLTNAMSPSDSAENEKKRTGGRRLNG